MNQQTHITIFGATGKIGRELIQFLSTVHIPTIAVTRDKTKMENSKAVFLASGFNDHFAEGHTNVIEVAKTTGVQHIVGLSSAGADIDSSFLIAKVHAQIDDLLKTSGIEWAILQPNAFKQNWLGEFPERSKRSIRYLRQPETVRNPI